MSVKPKTTENDFGAGKEFVISLLKCDMANFSVGQEFNIRLLFCNQGHAEGKRQMLKVMYVYCTNFFSYKYALEFMYV